MPIMQSSIMHRLIGRIRAVGKDRRAAAAVELALAMPALCLFIFGIIEVGYALWVQNALDYSVATAARCASLNGNACQPSGGNSQVTTYAANQSGANVTSTAFTYTPGAACGCQVSASYTIALDIPWDSALSVTLSSNSCVAPPPTKSCAS
jgi:Flp pilus assembly protein TadG